MRQWLNLWMPPGSFLRNVIILTGGTLFAQGLTVLALPALTRLYSPADFNLLAVYISTIGILTAVSCLRYNIAIPLPEDDADGLALLANSLLAASVLSLLCALLVIMVPSRTAALLGQPGIQKYLWMIPAGVFIASFYNALNYWAARRKRFGLIARTRVSRSVGGVGTQLGIGLYSASPFGLIFGHMIYGGFGIIAFGKDLVRRDLAILGDVTPERIMAQAKRYRRFPIYSVPEALFNTASVQLPIIIIAAAATGPEAAFLLLAMRVMGLPMGLVGRSVAQVYLAEAPERLRQGTLAAFTRKTMWALFKTGAPPLFAVGVISPFAFPVVFGEEWARAGWLVAWMTPWFILQFIATPVSMVLHVTGRQGTALALQGFGLVLRVSVVVAAEQALMGLVSEAYALSGFAFYGVYLGVISSVLKRQS